MHKAALLDLDSRPGCCKLSLDVSNAHNEYDRAAAARAVQAMVPELLPWARGGLGTAAVHVHVARDGSRTLLPKEQGGDQGDALTNQIFPHCYKHVAYSVAAAAWDRGRTGARLLLPRRPRGRLRAGGGGAGGGGVWRGVRAGRPSCQPGQGEAQPGARRGRGRAPGAP